jgi:hypothetical protein
MPVLAQAPAPTTTAFDGKYAGVSKESSRFVSGRERAHCAEYPKGVPASLTIMNGVIRSAVGGWEGTVSPQGLVVMRLPNAVRFDGQIDNHSEIRGQTSGPACVTTFLWRKQSG